MNHSFIKTNIRRIKLQKLVFASILIGFLSSVMALSLKKITESYETILYGKATDTVLLVFIFPIFGLSVIYILRQYLFKKKENKGITEIFESTDSKNKNLPLYKVPSHFINGFLTVIFGGSTGIEVSTVVASAAIGSVAQKKENLFRQYKTELICAGVAAGITALFNSPMAGILFAIEVISKKKISKTLIATTAIASLTSFGIIFLMDEESLFSITITTWNYKAIPYFLLLGIFAGLNAVYLTRCVLFFKSFFSRIKVHYHKIIVGAMLLSSVLLMLPQLYGDGYHAMRDIFLHPNLKLTFSLALTYLCLLIFKPVATSLTLASGGDGGVFAPSLFIGAFLGLLAATVLNTFFNADVIPINFMVIGMAAVLSASIHAPLTALFLICGVINDYTLFFPILAVCLISKFTAKAIYPFTVYTFVKASK